MRILLVEHPKNLARALKKSLNQEGYSVDLAHNGQEGTYKAESADYDVIILDLSLPQSDGLLLLRRWRAAGLRAHVLVLDDSTHSDDGVRALDLGADDYLSKPFRLSELLARVRTLARRSHDFRSPVISIHDLQIDTARRTVHRAGRQIHLTPREYALLEFLAVNCGQVLTRTRIWEHLYDVQAQSTSNVVDVYIGYLRNKIDKGFDPPLVLTRWGAGYLLREEERQTLPST